MRVDVWAFRVLSHYVAPDSLPKQVSSFRACIQVWQSLPAFTSATKSEGAKICMGVRK